MLLVSIPCLLFLQNQEFVFVCTDNKDQQDMLACMSRELIKSCTDASITKMRNLKIDGPEDSTKSKSFLLNQVQKLIYFACRPRFYKFLTATCEFGFDQRF